MGTSLFAVHDRAIERTIMWFPVQRILLWRVKKVASTSLSDGVSKWAGINNLALPWTTVVMGQALDLLRQDGVRAVGLCRHPIRRFLSAWGVPFGRPVPLSSFVEAACAISDAEINPHLRSQTWEAPSSVEWFPMERGGWDSIRAIFRERGKELPDLPWSNRSVDGIPTISKEDEARLRARYARDFSVLGYE